MILVQKNAAHPNLNRTNSVTVTPKGTFCRKIGLEKLKIHYRKYPRIAKASKGTTIATE